MTAVVAVAVTPLWLLCAASWAAWCAVLLPLTPRNQPAPEPTR